MTVTREEILEQLSEAASRRHDYYRRRDELVLLAHNHGISQADIAEAADMTQPGVSVLLRRLKG